MPMIQLTAPSGAPTELPARAQTTAEDDLPRFRVDVTVPEGALSDRRKSGLAKDATDA
ncbi:hypothetical protein ACIHFD_35560 [Nonomuraea sp. NPDC051941]|uniref:hypothetical protein n=1 Tax=Nonomuraea sp. NPDC051941 TaxID=3364373 RepID=UPI0037CB45A0